MKNKKVCVVGLHIADRNVTAERIQSILTKFGHTIRTRLGLHDISEDPTSPSALMILELIGDPAEFRKLENELKGINGVLVKEMVFPL